MGIRDTLAAKAEQARDAATARAREAAGSARDAATAKAREAADSAKDAVTARTDGALLQLLRMDDDRRITIEGVIVLLVAAVRKDEDRGLSDRDVLKAAKRRYRRLGALSLPSGPVGGFVINLYCEAATLCDLVELRGAPLADESVAAHLLVLWGVTPDLDAAAAAVTGLGPNAVAILTARATDRVARVELPEPMTKKAAIIALWRLRDVSSGLDEVEGTGVRERLFPARRVKAFIEEAEAQLERPVTTTAGRPIGTEPSVE